MAGIVAEGAEMIEEEGDDEVKDAGPIAAAQRVEHYEMAGYGTARTYAELLGDKEGAKLLTQTFEEEKETDQKLTKLAKSAINVGAAATIFNPAIAAAPAAISTKPPPSNSSGW